ncbi:MAG: hypothetical protein M1831_003699 [Alyxoria varia]|nr:MAG: hypothetical protein M1831_003699 [Alyxoria varia]
MARNQRGRKRARQTQDDVPQVYLDMLREETQLQGPSQSGTRASPSKKQKVTKGTDRTSRHSEATKTEQIRLGDDATQPSEVVSSTSKAENFAHDLQPQTVFDDSDSSSDSDIDWENLLSKETENDDPHSNDDDPSQNQISVDLGAPRGKLGSSKQPNRLPSTAVELRKRLNVHKMHLCCLLAHVYIRNAWSYDPAVQVRVDSMMDDRITNLFHLGPERNQFDRSNSFIKGLQLASQKWKEAFQIDDKGLAKPSWSLEPENAETPSELISAHGSTHEEFKTAAKDLKGSRDLGAQLFASFLRSADVSVRIVCSLQTLSFGNIAVAQAPENPQSNVIRASANASAASLHQHVSPTKRAPESRHPVFWAEAFNPARQRWIPVDPFATETVDKARQLEPPANDRVNGMTYVIAMDEEGAVRDVTRRYAKAYNAKTMKSRVEATNGGEKWYKKTLKVFKSRRNADRDSIENAELAQREAAEPLPKNVQDFKDHPYYALERHLKHNEVIHPKTESGKVAVGKGLSASVEPIYRRANVQGVKSADKWFRSGREIKAGQQPLRFGRKRRRHIRSLSADAHASDEEDDTVGLYAIFQTELHEPPACANGKVPRNNFGNLDVYVPSMIPPGAVHVRSSDAAAAARIINIDYADAIVGFQFKGRQGTAVTRGVIVATEYQEAMEATVEALRYQREHAAEQKKTQEALRLWKRFFKGLKIRERIMSEGEGETARDIADDIDKAEKAEEKAAQQGGFLLDKDQKAVPQPTGSKSGAPDEEDTANTRLRLAASEKRLNPREYLEPTVASPWDSNLLAQSRHYAEQKSLATTHGYQPEESSGSPEASKDDDLFDVDDGGGFIPVDNEYTPGHVDAHQGSEGTYEGAGRFVPDPAEKLTATSAPSEAADPLQGRLSEDMTRLGEVTNVTQSEALEVNNDLVQEPNDDQQDGHGASKHDSDEDDRGSLLSHDPEDEDAEPDWLEEVTTL